MFLDLTMEKEFTKDDGKLSNIRHFLSEQHIYNEASFLHTFMIGPFFLKNISDIRDIRRFFSHIGYTGKIEKKKLALLISIFGLGRLQQIVNYTKNANVVHDFVP